MSIDLDKIVAIDIHTHAEVGRTGEDGLRPEWRDGRRRSTSARAATPTVDDVAAYYRERKHGRRRLHRRRGDQTGRAAVRNEEIAEVAAANADVLIPFASVDPHRPDAVDGRAA